MDILVITAGGIGDALLGINAAILLQTKYPDKVIDLLACVRDEVFQPLSYLFSGLVNLYQHPDKEKPAENNGNLIINHKILDRDWPHKEKICIWPDLLFRANEYSFDYLKHGLSFQTIREYRALKFKWEPENIVYLGLNTSTHHYKYELIPELTRVLAKSLPEYKIYINDLTRWAGTEISNGSFFEMPPNVIYRQNEDFITSLQWLQKSCYCICVDNGISHISRSFGIPRLLITRYLHHPLKELWLSRWYPEINECISYELGYDLESVVKLVRNNLMITQTTLLNRPVTAANPDVDWSQVLGFKY